MYMRRLVIKDVGPITREAEVVFNRFCILIGPQSNGKSTIAKILSTCMWLEKESCTTLSESVIQNGEAFVSLVEDFHRMHNYIHSDRSYIRYESQYVKIIYDKGDFSLKFIQNEEYKRNKISYIPSDRNVVTMKDIEKRNLEPTNFRSFLFDWLDATPTYDSNHMTSVLNLGVKYFFDSQKDGRRDMLMHENGVTYAIPLYDASSGMQSVVPMAVLMHYLVNDYFVNYDKEQSFERSQKSNVLAWKVAETLTTKYFPNEVTQYGYKKVYEDEVKSKTKEGNTRAVTITEEMINLYNNLNSPQNISFIIEEPEQNLFPKTQVDLFSDIVSSCNMEHPSSAFMTTHSPYLLAAANILLFAGKLERLGVDIDLLKSIVPSLSFLYPGEFTAYSVSGGSCSSLINPETGMIQENELDTASDYNSEVFDKLYQLYIEKLKD